MRIVSTVSCRSGNNRAIKQFLTIILFHLFLHFIVEEYIPFYFYGSVGYLRQAPEDTVFMPVVYPIVTNGLNCSTAVQLEDARTQQAPITCRRADYN